MAEPLGLGNGEHELKIGGSFDQRSGVGFHSIRYDFKPTSVDTTQMASLNIEEGNSVAVTVPRIEGSGTTHTVYKGNKRPIQKECVLIIDHQTGEITLEKLSSAIQLKKTRSKNNKTKMKSNANVQRTQDEEESLSTSIPKPERGVSFLPMVLTEHILPTNAKAPDPSALKSKYKSNGHSHQSASETHECKRRNTNEKCGKGRQGSGHGKTRSLSKSKKHKHKTVIPASRKRPCMIIMEDEDLPDLDVELLSSLSCSDYSDADLKKEQQPTNNLTENAHSKRCTMGDNTSNDVHQSVLCDQRVAAVKNDDSKDTPKLKLNYQLPQEKSKNKKEIIDNSKKSQGIKNKSKKPLRYFKTDKSPEKEADTKCDIVNFTRTIAAEVLTYLQNHQLEVERRPYVGANCTLLEFQQSHKELYDRAKKRIDLAEDSLNDLISFLCQRYRTFLVSPKLLLAHVQRLEDVCDFILLKMEDRHSKITNRQDTK